MPEQMLALIEIRDGQVIIVAVTWLYKRDMADEWQRQDNGAREVRVVNVAT